MREVTIKKGRDIKRVTEKVFTVLYKDLGYSLVDTQVSDLKTLKVEDLRNLAKKAGIDSKGLKKEDLIKALEEKG